MDERQVVENTPGMPATVASLTADLRTFGLRPGMLVLVHSSLSALGWVCGGAAAVLHALDAAVGPQGTIVMPAQSGDLSDPEHWSRPPVPEAWKPLIREAMPPYDPARTPSRGVGVIAETFRAWPETVRSAHPQTSFAARGPLAHAVCDGHSLDYGLGEQSPLARIYDLDGWVLLLGVGHSSNTSLHLAEYRAEYRGKRAARNAAPIVVDGVRTWVEIRDVDLECGDFEVLGAAFAAAPGRLVAGRVGAGPALLMRQRELVDFAVGWMGANRGIPSTDVGPSIRAARASDRAEWTRLRHALWPKHPAVELGAELDLLLGDPKTAAFVAQASRGRLCGLIEVALRDSAEGCATRPVGYIEGWYVDPDVRGRGIGRRLAEAGEAWAREHGCTEMASDTTPEYPDSPAAHVAAGYERIQITFHFRKSL